MDDHLKTLGIFAGVGAALGVGVALGTGVKALAWGAAFGLGLGVTLGMVAGARPRLVNADFSRLE